VLWRRRDPEGEIDWLPADFWVSASAGSRWFGVSASTC